ncbi:MAG TPA: gamma-glutamylcyclotransferase family protein [Thermoleophilaceae bacterium]|nr:gamma-glutamylcyclotransferase family protein [Thermoleophilaceae bacterium]
MTLLFAYGSNMASSEMQAWCPDHRYLGPARLDGFRIELRRRSIRWRGGAADIVPAPGESVWGVVYEIADEELDRLDQKEGEGFAYRRRSVKVEYEGERRAAVAYEVIDKEPDQVEPSPEYLDLLRAAARERGLPR